MRTHGRAKVIPERDMAVKIRALVDARKDEDMVIIARTDALSAEGFDNAIRRGNLYKEEGADIIFIEAPTSMEELEKIPKLINGKVIVNVAPKTPYLHAKKYEEMGYCMAIYPPLCITTAYAAIKEMLTELKSNGILEQGGHGGVDFDELVDFLGLTKYRSQEEKLLSGPVNK